MTDLDDSPGTVRGIEPDDSPVDAAVAAGAAETSLAPRTAGPELSGPRSGSWKPEKITGDDLEAGLKDWIARVGERAARGRDKTRANGRALLAAALLLALIGVVILYSWAGSGYRHQYTVNQTRIDDLRTKTAGIGTPSDERSRIRSLQSLLTRAREAAGRVAAGQQRFAELAYQANTDPTGGDGAPGKAELAMVAHREDLAALWTASSLVVRGDRAYRFGTEDALTDQSRIDPRYPWYIRYDGTNASAPSTYRWSTRALMPRMDADRSVDVVWVCTQQSGPDSPTTVLAWASATFDGASGRFSHLSLTVAAEGARHAPGSGSATGTGTSEEPISPSKPVPLPSASTGPSAQGKKGGPR